MPGCTAANCTNSSQKGFKLYHFPTDKERNLIWARNCGRERGWKPTKHTCVCEVHFEESQFESHRADGLRKLKPNAIPTIFSSTSPQRGYNRKAKKEGNVESQASIQEKNEVDIAIDKTELRPEIEKNELPSKGEKKCSHSSDAAKSKEPDHTYPKFIGKEDKNTVSTEKSKEVPSEVFINVSVASKQDSSSNASVRRIVKRGNQKATKKRAKKVENNEQPSATHQNKRRRRSSGSSEKLNKELTKASDRKEVENEQNKLKDFMSPKPDDPEKKQCFVCGKLVEKGLSLYTLTNTTKVYMYQKLDKIVAGEMELLIEEEGILCLRCGNLLNYMDRIEVELSMLNKAILYCIRKNYGMGSRNEKGSENNLPNIEEGDHNNPGSLINLNGMETDTPVSSKEVEPGENYADDATLFAETENNNVADELSTFESVPGEELCCAICRFKTCYKSVMIFHLRHHLKEGFQCDFCNVPLPEDEISSLWQRHKVRPDVCADNENVSRDQVKDIASNEKPGSAEDVAMMESSSEALNDSSELLIAIVPVEDESDCEDDAFDTGQQRSAEDEVSENKNNNANIFQSFKAFSHEGLTKKTKQIRVLNEHGEIVTEEIEIISAGEDFEVNRIKTDDSAFSQFSLQEHNEDLESLNIDNKELVLCDSEVMSSIKKSESKSFRILNEVGMIVESKENDELLESSDTSMDMNDMKVNVTPGMLTYSNVERKLCALLRDSSADSNENTFGR